ncbi:MULTISPECIES: helix-turn-helix transcriptional regulator [unclassified Streptomyces]|uniref:helix-turn-helix transcriptional regulator n=1 Tax=unclassified Streptomyces TaxID=2593676 RepID=UPI002236F02C|nr:helix-turn-helix transcriptional regulator [Streptomyces sp. SHP 1-2]MCW5253886.1 helix-turn-helix transcriptional regulator [Streptomyces sp. SHP 1-2]
MTREIPPPSAPHAPSPSAPDPLPVPRAPAPDGDTRLRPAALPRRDGTDDELSVRAYEYALSRHAVTARETATALGLPVATAEWIMTRLRDLKLVRYCAEQLTYTATDPDSAQVELVLPVEALIHEKRREVACIHQRLGRFLASYQRHQRSQRRGELVAILEDPREVTLRLADSIRRGSDEILTMWPVSSHETNLLTETEVLSQEAAQRGVALRTLFPHTAMSHPSFRATLHQNRDAGVDVRTSEEIAHFLVVVDHEAAFLPTDSAAGRGPLVTAVYEPVIVNLLRGLFENVWQSACAFTGGNPPESALDSVKGSILRMLASGLKDDVIARRVGISSRTLRRHISVIMEELSAESRFQAGVAAANAGLVDGLVG